jgi:flagellar biosynthesis protein FliR
MGGIDGSVPQIVVRMFALVFVLGVRIAAPVLAVMIVMEIGLGFLARSAPSLNLMAVGAPVRAVVGLLLLVLAVPAIVGLIGGVNDSVVQLGVEAAKAFR